MTKILVTDKTEEDKILRKKAAEFDFDKYSKKDIRELIKKMRIVMKAADGIGLSANQIGLNIKLFIAQVDNKFYSIFNPKITKTSKEISDKEEGCLSVPDRFGLVQRPEKITLEGFDASNKKIKIKAWGLLARIFQHEMDHLEGVLFIDKAKEIYK